MKRKLYILSIIALAIVLRGLVWAEQITLTTYYPAPYGVYKEFSTTSNTYLATQSGNVGIATETPQAKLHLGGIPDEDGIMFPDGTLQTTAATGGQVAVITGTIAHGETIPLPAGYTQDQCKWFVSIGEVQPNESMDDIECYADANRVVTCRIFQDWTSTWANGTANYMVIGIK